MTDPKLQAIKKYLIPIYCVMGAMIALAIPVAFSISDDPDIQLFTAVIILVAASWVLVPYSYFLKSRLRKDMRRRDNFKDYV